MTNNYYQKHKKRLQKEAGKKNKISLKNKRTKHKKRLEKDVKILLKKKKKKKLQCHCE